MRLDRDLLVKAITTFLAGQEPHRLAAIGDAVGREIDRAGPPALLALRDELSRPADAWTYYPSDPLSRRIHHVLADHLDDGSVIEGLDHVAAVDGQPVVICANHLSYSDANVLEVLLYRSGVGRGLADRLTAMAGPKVYSSARRRFSSLCFGSIKTPQNSELSSEGAEMSPRDVARAARQCIDAAHERLRAGDALVVFPEGTRSRTRAMQQTLSGASRYLEDPDTLMLPIGIAGTEALFPVGDDALHPTKILVRVGCPSPVRDLIARADGKSRKLTDLVGSQIAEQLPPRYRGFYAAHTPQ